MGIGKKFESNFIDSYQDIIFWYRVRDSVGYSGAVSISDFMPFYKNKLMLLEMKTSKGISITVSPKYNKKGEFVAWGRLSFKQQQMMLDAQAKDDDIIAGYVMEFRKPDECYFILLDDVIDFLIDPERTRKSIPIDYMRKNAVLLPRTLNSDAWLEFEQRLLLEDTSLTANEVYENVKDKIDRTKDAITSKYYSVRKEGIKPYNGYLHYRYGLECLDMIIEAHENKLNKFLDN